MYRAAILSGHFEEKQKKGPPSSYFSKKQDANHVFFFVVGLNKEVNALLPLEFEQKSINCIRYI